MKAESSASQESDAGVDRLDQSVAKSVLERDQDRVDVVGDGVAEADEGADA